jgi:hypothetical protein
MLRNAALETENRSLKNEVQFLRGIVKEKDSANGHHSAETETETIDKYLNLGSPRKEPSMKGADFESPFDEQESAMSWVRSTVSAGSHSSWSTLFLLSIAVCVLVLPSPNPTDTAVVAQ